MKLLALVVLVGAVAVSAAFAGTSGSAAAKQRHPVVCPSAARIKGLPRWKAGGVVRGDVNGDGRRDAVSIRIDRWAPARCAFYLRVATGRSEHTLELGSLVGNIGKQANAPIRSWEWTDPAVEAIVDLGGRGNLIALLDNEGAADDFVDFVGLSHGRFRVIRMGLDLGGPMTYVARASCSRGGPLRHWEVFNAWTKKRPNRWAFTIDAYRRHGWRLTAVTHKTKYGSYRKMWQAANRAGIPSKALVGCSLARNPSFVD